jgi:hypothetical protein
MTDNCDEAINYSAKNSGNGWDNSQFSPDVRCVAMCEVINYEENIGELSMCKGKLHRPCCSHSPLSPFYRVELEELIVTRYLFLYDSNTMGTQAAVSARTITAPVSSACTITAPPYVTTSSASATSLLDTTKKHIFRHFKK